MNRIWFINGDRIQNLKADCNHFTMLKLTQLNHTDYSAHEIK